jgi:hypothetical protein
VKGPIQGVQGLHFGGMAYLVSKGVISSVGRGSIVYWFLCAFCFFFFLFFKPSSTLFFLHVRAFETTFLSLPKRCGGRDFVPLNFYFFFAFRSSLSLSFSKIRHDSFGQQGHHHSLLFSLWWQGSLLSFSRRWWC